MKFEIKDLVGKETENFSMALSESYKVLKNKNNKKIHVIEVKRNHYIRYKLDFISFI